MSVVELKGQAQVAVCACQARRLRLACAIVGLAAVALVVCGAFEASARSNVTADGAAALSAAGFDGVMGAGDAFALPASVPTSFEEELFSVSSLDCVMWSEGSRLVGWCQEGEAEQVLDALAARLAGKGWSCVSSGDFPCRSFSKSYGVYRWAFASASQVGGETSVVLQWASVEGGGA